MTYLRRSPVRMPTALFRPFSIHAQALDAVYRQLLQVKARQTYCVSDAQSTAVAMATKGYSVFLHLPTGAGKSLAFQAPALLTAAENTTLVVSPLIALIHVRI